MNRGKRKSALLCPEAAVIGRRIRQERWYEILSEAPHHGARKLAAALLVGAIADELRDESDRQAAARELAGRVT